MHRPLLLATGVFVTLVGSLLLFAPQVYLRLFVVEYEAGMDFAARRFAPAVLGLGILALYARNLPQGRFLTVFCLVTGLAFLGVAATGLHAWSNNLAQPAIVVAAAIEVILAILFVLAARTSGTQTH